MILNYTSFNSNCIALVHFSLIQNNFIKTNTKIVFNRTRIYDFLYLDYKQYVICFSFYSTSTLYVLNKYLFHLFKSILLKQTQILFSIKQEYMCAVFLNYVSFFSDCIALVHFLPVQNNFIKTNTKIVFNKTRINDFLYLDYKQHIICFYFYSTSIFCLIKLFH